MAVSKKKVFHRDIRDFQNAETFLFEEKGKKTELRYLAKLTFMVASRPPPHIVTFDLRSRS